MQLDAQNMVEHSLGVSFGAKIVPFFDDRSWLIEEDRWSDYS